LETIISAPGISPGRRQETNMAAHESIETGEIKNKTLRRGPATGVDESRSGALWSPTGKRVDTFQLAGGGGS